MLCKLTDQGMRTFGGFQWTLGKWERIKEGKPSSRLCTGNYFHFYESPELAVLLNPLGAGFKNPRGFECEVSGYTASEGVFKSGAEGLRLLREVVLPSYTAEQKAAFAILVSLGLYQDPKFVAWAEDWLIGINRTWEAAEAAAQAAAWAAGEATAAAWAAARAARAAGEATAWAAQAAQAAEAAAEAAAWAAAWPTTDMSETEFALFLQLCAEAAKDF